MLVVLMVGILFKRMSISENRLITLLNKEKNVKFITTHYKVKQCLDIFLKKKKLELFYFGDTH